MLRRHACFIVNLCFDYCDLTFHNYTLLNTSILQACAAVPRPHKRRKFIYTVALLRDVTPEFKELVYGDVTNAVYLTPRTLLNALSHSETGQVRCFTTDSRLKCHTRSPSIASGHNDGVDRGQNGKSERDAESRCLYLLYKRMLCKGRITSARGRRTERVHGPLSHLPG